MFVMIRFAPLSVLWFARRGLAMTKPWQQPLQIPPFKFLRDPAALVAQSLASSMNVASGRLPRMTPACTKQNIHVFGKLQNGKHYFLVCDNESGWYAFTVAQDLLEAMLEEKSEYAVSKHMGSFDEATAKAIAVECIATYVQSAAAQETESY